MHKDGAHRLKLLLVEDSEDDAELVLAHLRRGGYLPDARRVETPEDMRSALLDGEWDLIVADYTMPRFSATAALRLLRSTGIDLPFIIVSGTIGESTAVAAMKAGAHDYVLKDNLARLVPAIRRELREAEVRRERNAAAAQIQHMVYHDPLTGLPNRLKLLDRLTQAMFEADRYKRLVGVMFVDLDRIRTVNDSLGHDAGDELLRQVAGRLQECVRVGDSVARLDSDEFAVVLADLVEPYSASLVANKILESLNQPFLIKGCEIYTAASIGLSVYPHDARHIDELLSGAETAMHAAKEIGCNTYRFFTHEMKLRATDSLSLGTGLRKALARHEFELRYQPIVDLRNGRVQAVEALLHWRHPERGLLPPEAFLPLAEETGLIAPIGEWVMRTACDQALAWHERGIRPERITFNLSALQLNSPSFYAQISDIFAHKDLPASWFGIELSESGFMQQTELAAHALTELSGQGMWIGIDDFGTGYSSLGYLKKFPIDAVKIGASFVSGLPDNHGDVAIVKAIIGMAHSLGIKVVAEGVTRGEQLRTLLDEACDAVQGPLFGPALTAHRCEAALAGEWRGDLVSARHSLAGD